MVATSASKETKERILSVIVLTCRFLLGLVFLFSGTTKAIDPMGGAVKIGEYFSAFGFPDWEWLALPFAINLAAVEFTLGACLVLGVYRKYTAFLSLLMMLFMTPLTLYLALKNPVADCGCFGDALVLSNWQTFYKNIVLLAVAIVAFVYNQRAGSAYSYRAYWFVALYAYLFCLAFSLHNYWHLPVVDFRPFQIGANITEKMSVPDDAPQDEYSYSFIYEKEGKEKTFSLEEAPAADSTWHFVRSESQLVRKGYTPPISDFLVLSLDGDDMTDIILQDTTGVFLLIAHDLKEASDDKIDEINNTFDYAQDKKMKFYCLTGSDEETITQWVDYTGAEYPILFCDGVVLKTMIRSNPGLMLLKKGTILAKWHYNDIPDEQHIEKTVTHLLQSGGISKKEGQILTNILTFTVPLLLIWVVDFGRRRKRHQKAEELSENDE